MLTLTMHIIYANINVINFKINTYKKMTQSKRELLNRIYMSTGGIRRDGTDRSFIPRDENKYDRKVSDYENAINGCYGDNGPNFHLG